MDEHYQEWCEAAASGTYTPLPKERLAAMFLWTSQHGPANCWTGTTGTAAAMIRELLRERIRLVELTERLSSDVQDGACNEYLP